MVAFKAITNPLVETKGRQCTLFVQRLQPAHSPQATESEKYPLSDATDLNARNFRIVFNTGAKHEITGRFL
jgi:hypothetical protein